MKRAGDLWRHIVTLDNIRLAHKNARRGKTHYREVKMVDADPDKYFRVIQDSLINKTFTTSPYEVEVRSDGRKVRTIHKLPYYPDRIVQHALLNIVGPILVRRFIRDSFQSITGRGTSDAAKRVKHLIRAESPPRYALKVDVEKYYPSIDNEIMKAEIRRYIKCQDTLLLIEDVVDSTKGLPIGNYTSQHFGNLYLNRFDWWVKQEVKPLGYFRYCDDIVVMSDSKSHLMEIKTAIEHKLSELKLRIKPTWCLYSIAKNGLDFVGYVFRPTHTRLRKNIAGGLKDLCCELARANKVPDSALNRLMAYRGWVKQSSSKMLWRNAITPKLYRRFPKQLSRAV